MLHFVSVTTEGCTYNICNSRFCNQLRLHHWFILIGYSLLVFEFQFAINIVQQLLQNMASPLRAIAVSVP